jgi:hypothetical protein
LGRIQLHDLRPHFLQPEILGHPHALEAIEQHPPLRLHGAADHHRMADPFALHRAAQLPQQQRRRQAQLPIPPVDRGEREALRLAHRRAIRALSICRTSVKPASSSGGGSAWTNSIW